MANLPTQEWARAPLQRGDEAAPLTPASLKDEWAAPDYLSEDGGGEKAAGRPPLQRPLLQTDAVQFYAGSAGSGTQPHWHTSSWNVLLRGRKRWMLWPPARASYAQRHVALASAGARAAGGAPLVCEQQPGEVLIVPPLWGHATVNLAPSIGFATELQGVERAFDLGVGVEG